MQTLVVWWTLVRSAVEPIRSKTPIGSTVDHLAGAGRRALTSSLAQRPVWGPTCLAMVPTALAAGRPRVRTTRGYTMVGPKAALTALQRATGLKYAPAAAHKQAVINSHHSSYTGFDWLSPQLTNSLWLILTTAHKQAVINYHHSS